MKLHKINANTDNHHIEKNNAFILKRYGISVKLSVTKLMTSNILNLQSSYNILFARSVDSV